MINTKYPSKIIPIICTSLLLASMFAYADDTDKRNGDENKDPIQLNRNSTPAEIIIDRPSEINVETPSEITVDSPSRLIVESPDKIRVP